MRTKQLRAERTAAWQNNFKASCLRVGFRLGLSRAMCEFLSAVADGVQWNRASLGGASPEPDNFLATSRGLILRGLIERKPRAEVDEYMKGRGSSRYDLYNWSFYALTDAGQHVVALLKLANIFVEADAVSERKARANDA